MKCITDFSFPEPTEKSKGIILLVVVYYYWGGITPDHCATFTVNSSGEWQNTKNSKQLLSDFMIEDLSKVLKENIHWQLIYPPTEI